MSFESSERAREKSKFNIYQAIDVCFVFFFWFAVYLFDISNADELFLKAKNHAFPFLPTMQCDLIKAIEKAQWIKCLKAKKVVRKIPHRKHADRLEVSVAADDAAKVSFFVVRIFAGDSGFQQTNVHWALSTAINWFEESRRRVISLRNMTKNAPTTKSDSNLSPVDQHSLKRRLIAKKVRNEELEENEYKYEWTITWKSKIIKRKHKNQKSIFLRFLSFVSLT